MSWPNFEAFFNIGQKHSVRSFFNDILLFFLHLLVFFCKRFLFVVKCQDFRKQAKQKKVKRHLKIFGMLTFIGLFEKNDTASRNKINIYTICRGKRRGEGHPLRMFALYASFYSLIECHMAYSVDCQTKKWNFRVRVPVGAIRYSTWILCSKAYFETDQGSA